MLWLKLIKFINRNPNILKKKNLVREVDLEVVAEVEAEVEVEKWPKLKNENPKNKLKMKKQ